MSEKRDKEHQIHLVTNSEKTTETNPASVDNLNLHEVAEEITTKNPDGLVDDIRHLVNSNVQEGILPTEETLGYKSTVGIYGGKLVHDDQGKMVYDTRGLWSKIDRWGDRVLRSFEEHYAKNPKALALNHPKTFLKLLPLIVDSKRYRGTPEQALENVHRFGLDDYYGAHPWGIEIKQSEVFSRAIGLQDVFRQDEINHPAITSIDRFQALGAAADYMHELHQTAGGIAEGNTYSFLFTERNGDEVSKPIIMIPSEVYNPEKNISLIEQKATDLLDLLMSAAAEEYRRAKDLTSVQKCLRIILDHYQDVKVIAMVWSYAKRGRLTIQDDDKTNILKRLFSAHSTQRLNIKNPEATGDFRREIIDTCHNYIEEKSLESL